MFVRVPSATKPRATFTRYSIWSSEFRREEMAMLLMYPDGHISYIASGQSLSITRTQAAYLLTEARSRPAIFRITTSSNAVPASAD